MSKRVYKLTSAHYGICNLQNKRLKLSTVDDLIDPFDLCPLDTTDPVISNAVNAVITRFRQTKAILCFSRNWDNLLLYSFTVLNPNKIEPSNKGLDKSPRFA